MRNGSVSIFGDRNREIAKRFKKLVNKGCNVKVGYGGEKKLSQLLSRPTIGDR